MQQVVGALVIPGGCAALVTGCATPRSTQYTGVNDSDPSDALGYGRTGFTDADPTDQAYYGRGMSGGVTDSDPVDVAGSGRGARRPSPATAMATGFFISTGGYLVTNHHVIADRSELSILRDGVNVPATLVASDPANDIAILHVEGESQALALGTAHSARVGQEVFSMGYPMATIQGGELRANFGRVNALSGFGGDARFMQVDVPVQPGSSGGPLIGADGSVVGIVSARLNDLATLRATGALPENIGYAIKIDYLLPLLPEEVIRNLALLTGTLEERVQAGRGAVVQVVAVRPGPPPKQAAETPPASTPAPVQTPIPVAPAPTAPSEVRPAPTPE